MQINILISQNFGQFYSKIYLFQYSDNYNLRLWLRIVDMQFNSYSFQNYPIICVVFFSVTLKVIFSILNKLRKIIELYIFTLTVKMLYNMKAFVIYRKHYLQLLKYSNNILLPFNTYSTRNIIFYNFILSCRALILSDRTYMLFYRACILSYRS